MKKHKWFSYEEEIDLANRDREVKISEEVTIPQWFHIKARAMDIFKPDGKVITFWLYGNSETHIREMIGTKNYKDIEWIKPVGDTLPFI